MAIKDHLIPVPGLQRVGLDPYALHLDCGIWGRVPRSGGNEGVVMLSDDARAGR
jgi:hypothetical protein